MKIHILLIVLTLLGINLYSQTININYTPRGSSVTTVPSRFDTREVGSDFGPRILGAHPMDWHGGIDLSVFGVEDLGYNILAITGGTVRAVDFDGVQTLVIDGPGQLDFGYRHIFQFQVTHLGDYEMLPINNTSRYAILNTRTNIAIGACPGGCSNGTFTVTFNNQTYNVTDNVTTGQAIAPLGTSDHFASHLHVQRYKDISLPYSPIDQLNDDLNAANPLELIPDVVNSNSVIIVQKYPSPTYTTTLSTINSQNISIKYPNSNNSSVITDAKTSIKARVNMIAGENCDNHVMDIESVSLNLSRMQRKTGQPLDVNKRYYNYINDTYSTETNQQNCLVSLIQYGALSRTGVNIDPNTNPPRIINWRYPQYITQRGLVGGFNRQGIAPFAYVDGSPRTNPNSYDDFYFTDFIPRRSNTNKDRLADIPDDAQYNDGAYLIYPVVMNAQDTRASVNEEKQQINIDNFKPYIKNVKIIRNDGTKKLLCESNWSASSNRTCIQLDNYKSPYTIGSNQEYDNMMASSYPVKVVVTSSEPLQELKMGIPMVGLVNATPTTSNDMETEFVFDITTDQLKQLIRLNSAFGFNFTGKDYDSHGLLALQAQQTTCVKIPKHLSTGWGDDMQEGTDVSHAAYIKLGSGCTRYAPQQEDSNVNLVNSQTLSPLDACIYVDFKYTIGSNGDVKFTDISTGQTTLTSWQWTFGDGGSGSHQHPTHRYNLLGVTTNELCFDVKLTVTDASGNTGSEIKHICVPVSTNGSLYVQILNPRQIYDSPCNKNWVKAITLQEMRFEGSVLGGTPPYRFDWDMGAPSIPSYVSGPGPHYVKFTVPSGGGSSICDRFSYVKLKVTDANNVVGSAEVKVNIRNLNDDGPGTLKIVCNKTIPCENEEVSLTVKAQDPFGFVWPETYKWFIDNQEQPEIFKKIKRKFTAGNHTIRVEVTDGGGSIIKIDPLSLTVNTTQECNTPGTVSPKFEILVNNRTDGTSPLVLDALNPCSGLDGSIDPITNGKTSKIHIRVPNLGTASDRDNSILRQVPDYFFKFEIEYNGVKKALPIAGGYGPNDNIVTEKWLKDRNYLPRINGASLEYPIPLCFADCGAVFGNSRLVVSVGRFAELPVSSRCVQEAVLPPSSITNSCTGISGTSYFDNCPAFVATMTNEGLSVQVCRNPVLDRSFCSKPTFPEMILNGEVIQDMKTGFYDIFVKHDDPPLSISEIRRTNDCNAVVLSTTISGGVTQVPDFSSNSSFICSQSNAPYTVKWQIFDYNNPTKEIVGTIFSSPNNILNPSINLAHDYFRSFAPNENRLFVAQVTAIDIVGNRMTYAQVMVVNPLLTITLKDEINRCAADNIPLSNIPIVVGGKLPYTFSWTGGITSTSENPTLNLAGQTSPLTTTLMVTDNSSPGCTVSKTIKITPKGLQPISLGNSPIIACANSSSVKKIGPVNATNQRDLENDLGGSGDYSYRWTAEPVEGLDKLSDPTIPYPTVSSDGNGDVTYQLVITDNLGGCTTSSNRVIVQGLQTIFNVELGADKILCGGLGNTVTLTATTKQGNGIMSNALLDYQWSSDDPNFISNSTSNVLVLNNIPNDSRHTYTVTSIFKAYGCSSKDDIVVDIKKTWTYKGYEAVTAPLLVGKKGPLWKSIDNEIFANDANGSGAVTPLTNSFLPIPLITEAIYGNYGAIKQGNISGNSTTITMTDNAGCSKSFPSNTYYMLSKNPTVLVSSNKQIVCSGGEICLYLTLNTNIASGNEYLPLSFSVPFKVQQASLLSDGTWYYFNNGNPPFGDVEFNLTDVKLGIYTAITCFRVPNNGNLTKYALLIDGGLPNSDVTGAGKFKVEYQFNASPSGPIRLTAGFVDPFTPRGFPEVAYHVVTLGGKGSKGQILPLTIKDNAYAEFAASRSGPGQVLMEFDVDVQASTRYFHAFIDPCITIPGNIAQQNAESSLVIHNNENSAKGAFSVHPSPFANDITLNYEVRSEKGSTISLNVYNSFGQLVDKVYENRFHSFGVFSTVYDTGKLTTGIYIFELTMDGEKFIRKSLKVN